MEKIKINKKGWNKTITALILAVIALALLFFFLLTLLPNLRDAAGNIMLGIKKPICCDMMACTGMGTIDASKLNPMCSVFCWGVCD